MLKSKQFDLKLSDFGSRHERGVVHAPYKGSCLLTPATANNSKQYLRFTFESINPSIFHSVPPLSPLPLGPTHQGPT